MACIHIHSYTLNQAAIVALTTVTKQTIVVISKSLNEVYQQCFRAGITISGIYSDNTSNIIVTIKKKNPST
jgi:hypothetical protein